MEYPILFQLKNNFADLIRDTCRKSCNRIEIRESFYWEFTVTLCTVPKRQNWEMHLPSQSRRGVWSCEATR